MAVAVKVALAQGHGVQAEHCTTTESFNAAFAKQWKAKTGDTVEIQEGRPISKTKAWTVTRVVEVAQTV